MPTFKKFEEIDAWIKCRALAKKVYDETSEGTFARDFKLKDQINASCGSVMDNIAEGFERDGTKEFIQFLSIAKGSAGEFRSQLYRSLDRNHIDKKKFDNFANEIISISNLIGGLIRYLKSTEIKGKKYKPNPNPSKSKSRQSPESGT
jgi:four helix bundle protein